MTKSNKIKEEFNLSKSREIVKQILQGVYTGSENHRIIELIFANVETQDKEFIRLFKKEYHKQFLSQADRDYLDMILQKLTGDKLLK